MYLDLNEAIDLGEFAADYADYELDIVDPEIGSPVAVLGSEWCATHGANLDWIVLTKQLTNEEEVIVPVKVYAVLCNGDKILGKSANVTINLAKGSVIPTQWENKFTLNADGTVTWNLEGQNTLAKGQNATCDITFTIEYGKVKPSQVITDCTETSPVLGGGKLTGKFTIKAWNADEFPVE